MTKRKAKTGTKTNTIEVAVNNFLKAWKKSDLRGMLDASTLTFRAFNKLKYFEDWFKDTKLLSYEIGEIDTKGKAIEESAIANITVKLEIKTESSSISKEFTVTAVKEKTAYLPSINGSWGVTPATFLKVFNPDIPVIK